MMVAGKRGKQMDSYVTGAMIKRLREEKNLTQEELASSLHVSGKAVSKWETGKGYPDITLVEPLASALGVSVPELLSGSSVMNTNRSFNVLRSKLYVCPLCGNVIFAGGEAVVSCCGISLSPLEMEEPDAEHALTFEKVEDEYYVTAGHEMTKTHYISFLMGVYSDSVELKKLYPEGAAESRFKVRGLRYVYAYCNRHGLFREKALGR